MATREEDITETMFMCSSHDLVLFFTSAGRVYRLKCYEVPEGSRTAKGTNIINLLPIENGEKVTAMIRVPTFDPDKYLCMVTRHGIIKRTRLDAFSNARKSGLIAVDLDEGDELAWVQMTDGYQQLLVATRNGMAICFDENDARVVGRTARGVRAIALADGDEVVGMIPRDESKFVLTVTETGYGRLSEFSDYRIQSRGGKGLTNYHTDEYGAVAGIRAVNLTDDIILISSGGIIIRMPVSEIRQCRRPSKGVRVMTLKDDTRIVSMADSPAEPESETAEAETSAEQATPTEE